jgi:hypothetical protein
MYVIVLTNQGDQIGRIFADWAAVYFGQFIENFKSYPNYWASIFHDTRYVHTYLTFTKNELGYILGDFFTNSSGHPVTNVTIDRHIGTTSNSSPTYLTSVIHCVHICKAFDSNRSL